MKPRNYMLCLVIFMVTFSCSRETNTYYVSAGGNDANKGTTIPQAWKTIDRVNKHVLIPGSKILFEGGSAFEGTLLIDSTDSSSGAVPIIITSYGSGQATINGGKEPGVLLTKSKNILVKKINVRGDGRNEGNHSDGFSLSECRQVEIDSVDISGFQHSGLSVFKCSDIRITYVSSHDNGFAGIHVSGTTIWDKDKYDNENISIAHCRADNNPGDPTVLTNHSGNGILASSVKNGIIEYCEASGNGWDMPWHGNGPVGIWIWDCTDFTIQYCISHDNKTSKGSADGGGFDFDGGVSNSVLQYCLSYHNWGPGIGLFEFGAGKAWQNNIVRYNISHDDGLNGQGSLAIWKGNNGGTIRNCEIYNNTFYNGNIVGPNLCFMNNWEGFNFTNNVFVYKGTFLSKGSVTKNEQFIQNCYWNLEGKKSQVRYSNYFADPLLNDTATAGFNIPEKLNDLNCFIPKSGSPLIDNGADVSRLPGGNNIRQDFYGHPIPTGKQFDIGAIER